MADGCADGSPDCPFMDTMELLSRRYALCLLWSLQKERPRRFGDIRKALDMNAVTLSQRLKEFEAAGLVTRTTYNEIPPRVDYDLTAKGLDLLPILDTLEGWSDKWESLGEPAEHGGTLDPVADPVAA